MKLHYTKTPGAVDMAGYAAFYQAITSRIAADNAKKHKGTIIVEAGTRYGCSARIFRDTLHSFPNWQLILTDPTPQPHALALTKDKRVAFHRQKAEQLAPRLSDRSIDLLHIDVDPHTYETAQPIVLAYWNKLKENGEVIFHDCTAKFPGIPQMVDDLVSTGQWDVAYAEPCEPCFISAPAHLRRKNDDLCYDNQITVVLPVYKDRWLPGILKQLKTQTLQPAEIIVIDNSGGALKGICDSFPDLPGRYLPQSQNIGVNASWNLGIELAKTELVAILNDDLIIPETFLADVAKGFSMPLVGLVVPNTVTNQRLVGPTRGLPFYDLLPQREGWAFGIKKSLCEPIPKELFTFCGDDFLYHVVKDRGFWPVKLRNTRIFHHGGVSFNIPERKRLGLPEYRGYELPLWHEIKAERGWA